MIVLCYYEYEKDFLKEDAVMNTGEFHSSKEYNDISEYKHFPAELYTKPREENPSGREDADLGKETTSLQHTPKAAQKSSGAQALIDKLFGSIRGVATAATVAAASVVATTVFMSAAPQADLVDLNCGDTYIEYQMEVTGLNDDGEYAIVLSTTTEDDIATEIDTDGTYRNRIDGLIPEWEYTLALVQYDTVLGEVRHFETKLQTLKHSIQEPMPPPESELKPTPVLTVTDIQIIGINEIEISFTSADLTDDDTVELNITFGDLSTSRLILTDGDIVKGSVRIPIESSDTLTVAPKVISDDGSITTECQAYSRTFETTLSVEAMVSLYDKTILFYPIGITRGAEYIHLTRSDDPEASDLLWIEDVITIWYESADIVTYTMYLTNENGDILSNEAKITLDTSLDVPSSQFNISCPNPGQLCITYNDDGTVNIYSPTDFEAESEDIYYQITLGAIRYTSRERLARIENLPDESYALRYDVCIDIDGIQYSIFNTVPSGMANEQYFYIDSSLSESTLTLTLYEHTVYPDMSSVRLLSSNGEQILLSEADFIYDEEYATYSIVVELAHVPEYVVVYLMGNPYYLGIENIDGYIGSPHRLLEYTVYQM